MDTRAPACRFHWRESASSITMKFVMGAASTSRLWAGTFAAIATTPIRPLHRLIDVLLCHNYKIKAHSCKWARRNSRDPASEMVHSYRPDSQRPTRDRMEYRSVSARIPVNQIEKDENQKQSMEVKVLKWWKKILIFQVFFQVSKIRNIMTHSFVIFKNWKNSVQILKQFFEFFQIF